MSKKLFGAPPTLTDASNSVVVRGAREHNLKEVDVSVPRDALVVFSGVSGSGKSSLAFGTIYAEAQRRYFESVAPYARRLIDQAGVPDVDAIDGLPPCSCPSTTARNQQCTLFCRQCDHLIEPGAHDVFPGGSLSGRTTYALC